MCDYGRMCVCLCLWVFLSASKYTSNLTQHQWLRRHCSHVLSFFCDSSFIKRGWGPAGGTGWGGSIWKRFSIYLLALRWMGSMRVKSRRLPVCRGTDASAIPLSGSLSLGKTREPAECAVLHYRPSLCLWSGENTRDLFGDKNALCRHLLLSCYSCCGPPPLSSVSGQGLVGCLCSSRSLPIDKYYMIYEANLPIQAHTQYWPNYRMAK